MNWSLTQLQYIVAVADVLSFHKAADKCRVTQPTLSMQIQKLEAALGFAIFDRSSKPVRTTVHGESVVAQARIVIEQAKQLDELAAFTVGEVAGTLRLGILPTLAPYILPLFVANLGRDYPALTLDIRELHTDGLTASLKAGAVDVGLLTTPLDDPALVETDIFQERFVVYANKNHALARRKCVAEKDLDPSEMWLLEEGHCLRLQALSLCGKRDARGGEKAPLRLHVGSLETLIRLVERAKGFTLLPELAIPKRPHNAVVVPFCKAAPVRNVALVTHRTFPRQEILAALRKAILKGLPRRAQQNQARVVPPLP